MKKISVVMFSLLFLTGSYCAVWAGNNAGAAFKAWPDTGQEECYDNSSTIGNDNWPEKGEPFYGQDAQYQGPFRSYTKLGRSEDGELIELPKEASTDDGWLMTRDNVTGLIWEIKQNRDGTEDHGNPHDADNRYDWCDTDENTNGGAEGCNSTNNMEEFINQLNAMQYGGFSDWRMPTVKELATLVNIGGKFDVDGDNSIDPAIDTDFFPETMPYNYWSATTDMTDQENAWYVCFDNRCVYELMPKNKPVYVRAVRGGRSVTEDRFIDNKDGTVTDKVTSLMWQKCLMGQSYNDITDECEWNPNSNGYYMWEEALEQCSELELAGFDNWRLPNRNELMSILYYSSYAPAYDASVFPNMFPEDSNSCSGNFYPYTFWTSSTAFEYDFNFNAQPTSAFFVDFCMGTLCSLDKTGWFGTLRARSVRSMDVDGDHDYDKDIDGADLANMAYYSKFGNGYDAVCDLNYDHWITSEDIEEFAKNFGRVQETPVYY